MKQLFVLLLSASLSGYSQDYAKHDQILHVQSINENEEGPYEVVIKKNNSYTAGYLNNIPADVLGEFAKAYPAAKNVSWFVDEKSCTVYFDSNGQISIVKYKNDGLPLMIKKSYGAAYMSSPLANFIKEDSKGYEIKYISELQRPDVHLYEINLVKNEQWLVLKIGEDVKGFQVLGRVMFDKN